MKHVGNDVDIETERDMNMYYVIMSHNFDAETCIWEFDEYQVAVAFLHWEWERYYNEEIACESRLNENECFHDWDYAKVEWSDGDYTEFTLVEGLDDVPSEFEEEWERYAP